MPFDGDASTGDCTGNDTGIDTDTGIVTSDGSEGASAEPGVGRSGFIAMQGL